MSNVSQETHVGLSNSIWSDRLKNIIAISIVSLSVGINLTAPILVGQWIQYPFVGVLFEKNLVVSPVYYSLLFPYYRNINIDIAPPNQLQTINNVPVLSSHDLIDVLKYNSVNDKVHLTFTHADSEDIIDITATLTSFPFIDLFMLFGVPYFIGLFYLGCAVSTIHWYGVKETTKVFALFCALFAILTGTIFDLLTYHYLSYIWIVTLPFIGASLAHLSLVFPVKPREIKRNTLLQYIPYTFALLLSIASVWETYTTGSFLTRRLSYGFILLSILFFFRLMIRDWQVSISHDVRRQAIMILRMAVLAYAPVAIWSCLYALGYTPPLSKLWYIIIIFPTITFPISLTYILCQDDLSKYRKIFRTILLYCILAIIAGLIYAVLTLVIISIFQLPHPVNNHLFTVVYTACLIALAGIGREWLRDFINRHILPPKEDYQRLIQEYAKELASHPLNVNYILDFYLSQIQTILPPKNALVFLIDIKESQYTIRSENEKGYIHVSYLLSDTLPQWLNQHPEPIILDNDGLPTTKITVDQEEIARLAMFSIRLVIPLMGKEELLGWLALQDKITDKPYTPDELDFLINISEKTLITLENAQLFETANRKTKELLALQDTSLDIASEQDTDRILMAVVERATNLLNAMGGSIYLLDQFLDVLNNKICFNLSKNYADIHLKIGEGIAGRVVQDGNSRIIPNYQKMSDQYQIYPSDTFGPVVAVPFTWKGQVRGVLELIRHTNTHNFTEEDVELLEVLASQSAIALENARLIREAHEKASQLQRLHEVNQIISATLDRETALRVVTKVAVEILNTEAGSIFVVDPTGQFLIFEIALGPKGMALVGQKIPLNKNSIAGSIVVNQKPMIVNDVASDPHWNINFDKETDFKTRDILGVPMSAFNRIIGVVEVINKKSGRGFTEDDLTTLVIFASQAAIAIVNAERFTQTDKELSARIQELNTLQMIDHELSASLEFDAVLELTISRTMDAFGANVGLIGIINKDRQGLLFKTMVGVAKKYDYYKTTVWNLNKGILGKVAKTGQPIIAVGDEIDNLSSDCRSTSQLCVPIILEEQVIGVISMELADLELFNETDKEFALRLADHAALAIRNAQLFEEVNAANQAKTEFMSVASHELKNPMTNIKGYTTMLEHVGDVQLSEQQQEFIHVIHSNIERMNRIVSDLLDVSRIEAGYIKLEMDVVSIQNIIKEVMQSMQTQIDKKHIKFHTNIPDAVPNVRGDHGRLVQIMANLVSNACKYTPENGNVFVNVEWDDKQYLTVNTTDTGYGISEEDQKKLFDKFFRSADQNIRDERGTGLGLSITKSMIEMHGGELWFESKLGKGSTFSFSLPLVG